ncbi:hypothetical protein GCM10009844_29810 [Nocardioides koreensis]|uniref:Uncharacterized protein n=1 Tax=Nocardioides koreensis TaxID=433651 RepID=A0ABP5LLR7_9ACTN
MRGRIGRIRSFFRKTRGVAGYFAPSRASRIGEGSQGRSRATDAAAETYT